MTSRKSYPEHLKNVIAEEHLGDATDTYAALLDATVGARQSFMEQHAVTLNETEEQITSAAEVITASRLAFALHNVESIVAPSHRGALTNFYCGLVTALLKPGEGESSDVITTSGVMMALMTYEHINASVKQHNTIAYSAVTLAGELLGSSILGESDKQDISIASTFKNPLTREKRTKDYVVDAVTNAFDASPGFLMLQTHGIMQHIDNSNVLSRLNMFTQSNRGYSKLERAVSKLEKRQFGITKSFATDTIIDFEAVNEHTASIKSVLEEQMRLRPDNEYMHLLHRGIIVREKGVNTLREYASNIGLEEDLYEMLMERGKDDRQRMQSLRKQSRVALSHLEQAKLDDQADQKPPKAAAPKISKQELNAPDPIEPLLRLHANALQDLTLLQAPYAASMRTLKQAGLNALLRDLQHGYTSEASTFDGITAADAKQTIQALYGIQALAERFGDTGQLKPELGETIVYEHELTTKLQAVRAELYKLGRNGFDPISAFIGERIEWMHDNHEAFAELLSKHLPPSEAVKYVAALNSLFANIYNESVEQPEPVTELLMPEVEIPEIPAAQELPVFNIEDLLPKIPIKETEVALQLDWEVFPQGTKLEQVRDIVEQAGHRSSSLRKVEWERIADLMQIAEAYDGTLYRAKPRSLGMIEPYFVTEVTIEDKTFVIAEHPQYGNATYVLRTDRAYEDVSWKELFELPREYAREFGAERIVHREGRSHLDRIMDNIQSQLLVKSVK